MDNKQSKRSKNRKTEKEKKLENSQENAPATSMGANPLQDFAGAGDIFAQLTKMLSGSMTSAPNLTKIEEYETLIDQEMETVQNVLTCVAKDQFEQFEDEQRESKQGSE